ncbi:HD-GYP domain-containing protein [Pseudoduganella sp. RAF19]|uniref:HD-GYP domain-containing protein n=1 Tax=Pseudoduganella sp. RAF19 TaxID=3233052 RepID=UPI003F9A67E8
MNAKTKPVILIADASAENLVRLNALLQDHYETRLADDGPAALRLAQVLPRPDLVLADVDIGGAQLCQQLRANPDTAAIPLIIVVGRDDDAHRQDMMCEGAADVVTRPIVAEVLLSRVASQLELKQARELLSRQGRHLEQLVAERTRELAQLADAAVWALASLAEKRHGKTDSHLSRVQHYVEALARGLQAHPRFAHELKEEHIPLLFKAAPLHDIGKVAVPDAILNKPDKLTPEEFEVMKQHTVHGRDAIDSVAQRFGASSTFLRFAREITYSHQERYDGSGYPEGLAGEAIPVSARLLAVADVYDALISRRVYKPAFTHETAIELIRQGSGEHFDPDVVDAMLAIEEQFMDIAARFPDPS